MERGVKIGADVPYCILRGTALSEGIGDTVRVSLTEDPEAEIPVAAYLAERYDLRITSSMTSVALDGRKAVATYDSPTRMTLLMDVACDFGKRLMDRTLDDLEIVGTYVGDDGRQVSVKDSGLGSYLTDEMLQACRRRFYKPEYVACPGCGRTMYDLQAAFEEVKARTSHLKNIVIAVMGCIVNGPGEMADADWGYVGEGNHKVTIYKGKTPVLRHIQDTEAVERLVELIEKDQSAT